MRDHEGALVTALIAHLRADAGVCVLLGTPARIWDAAPADAGWPRLVVTRGESRPVAAEGCGIEHQLTLTAVSRFPGAEEARGVAAAVRAALSEAALAADGVKTISLTTTGTQVFRSADGQVAYAVIRVRAVTEESGE